MSNEQWRFRIVSGHTEIFPPTRVNEEVITPLADLLFSEISGRQSLDRYRRLWAEMSADREAAQEGIAGNGTCQSLEGDDVILESLYEQYEPVRMRKEEFEIFLDQYARFLDSTGVH